VPAALSVRLPKVTELVPTIGTTPTEDPVSPASCNAVKAKKDLIVCLAPDRRVSVEVKGSKTVVVK
jgi:hypothetical protein